MISTAGPAPVPDESPDEGLDHLAWERTEVDGRPALYGVAGEGLPVLFLHGWALGHHSYKRPLKRLIRLGCRVYAPAQPGFAGTPGLPRGEFSLEGYARWAADFLDAVGVREPALVIGHSFGGGVGIQLAHDHPDKVRSLVLVNSIGASMRGRPLWDWGLHFPSDVLPLRQLTTVLPVVLEDALPNLLRDPLGLWRVGRLARNANLTAELEELKARQLPVVVLWGDRDGIIPKDAFASLCQALGSEGEVVNGNHSWLLADPDAFGEVITNVVSVAQMARQMEADKPRRGLRGLLRSRTRRIESLSRKAGAGNP